MVSVPLGDRLNICGRHHFRVDIDGMRPMGFREIEGVNVNIEPQEYREGSDPLSTVRLDPGLTRCGPLVLRYGVTASPAREELWDWMRQSLEGNLQRRDISIIVLDRKNTEVARYNLINAWPSSWRLDKLDTKSSAPLLEEVTIQYENLYLETSK